ncbi:uncharacterized protein LOC110023536 [Phalaenopsis equestris]|uniref:uncharacterized protein LOC110023536 n=1 Tax=Phalaenopsis equestris TaxID=78828 RepID=UPI0009E497A1|nr:uncharacterized protein LOC110023536 [Phalaenopsis equestris]
MKKFSTIQSQLSPGLAKITLPSSSLFRRASAQEFSTQHKESSEILGKARSDAEEFVRQAKEKAASLKETAGEVIEDAKESVSRGDEAGKEKLKGKEENVNRD